MINRRRSLGDREAGRRSKMPSIHRELWCRSGAHTRSCWTACRSVLHRASVQPRSTSVRREPVPGSASPNSGGRSHGVRGADSAHLVQHFVGDAWAGRHDCPAHDAECNEQNSAPSSVSSGCSALATVSGFGLVHRCRPSWQYSTGASKPVTGSRMAPTSSSSGT